MAGMQDQIIKFLSCSASYRAQGDDAKTSVAMMETHCSLIFLVGSYAYKLKQAVKYPFLDFSTLEKRHNAALNELKVNKRYTSDLYLGLVAIVKQSDGTFALFEPDNPPPAGSDIVEWLVKMRRFEQDALYSSRAATDTISSSDAIALAHMVDRLHEVSEPRKAPEASAASLARVVAETIAFFDCHPDLLGLDLDKNPKQNRIVTLLRNSLERHGQLILERAQQGYVRHCHGDLHLANIVSLKGQPAAFDAIEFDDEIATNDVLYDLAFLLMDLWRFGLTAQCNLVLSNYLSRGHSELSALDGLALMPLFLALRSLIRLRAATLKEEHHGGHHLSREAQQEIDHYGDLALQSLSRKPSMIIAIGGLSGTGKSTIARTIASHCGEIPGAIVLRSDVERKSLFGRLETEPLPASAYTRDVTRRVYERLGQKAELIAKTGMWVILDAVYAQPDERQAAELLAQQAGVGFQGIWLDAPQTVLAERVGKRRGDASDADQAIVAKQFTYDLGNIGWQRIDASGTPEETHKLVLQSLTQTSDTFST